MVLVLEVFRSTYLQVISLSYSTLLLTRNLTHLCSPEKFIHYLMRRDDVSVLYSQFNIVDFGLFVTQQATGRLCFGLIECYDYLFFTFLTFYK